MALEDLSELKRLRSLWHALPEDDWERIARSLDTRTLDRLRNHKYGPPTEEEFRYIIRLLDLGPENRARG